MSGTNPAVKSPLTPPQDKHKLYLNRFNLLLQRLRRNRRFQPPNPLQAAAGAAPQAQLTELMGLKGSAGETCIVMGIIGSQVRACAVV